VIDIRFLGPEIPPNDRRHFLHKRVLRGIKGLATGGPLGAIGGFLTTPTAPVVRRAAPRTLTARPTQFSAAEKEAGRELKFGDRGGGAGSSSGREGSAGGSRRGSAPSRHAPIR